MTNRSVASKMKQIGFNLVKGDAIMKKEQYENLEFEVIRFRNEDIITTSDLITDRESNPTGQQGPFIVAQEDDIGTVN